MKLTGLYGIWKGQEVELASTMPDGGMLLLIKAGGVSPGPEWLSLDHGDKFPRSGIEHSLEVPVEEVTNIHSILATGELSPRRVVSIYAEDQDGNLAVVAGTGFWTEDKQALIDNYGFETGSVSEPVSRLPVFGWLPADKVSNIKSIVDWRQNDPS